MSGEKKGTISKRTRSSTLGKGNPFSPELMEERKAHLYEKQAQDYALWISAYVGCEPLGPDLVAALLNGTILLKLIKRVDPNFKEIKFPKHAGEANLFQIRETLARFTQGCIQIGVPTEDIFEPEDLIEGNKVKVLKTLQCIRKIADEAIKPTPSIPTTPLVEAAPIDVPATPEQAPQHHQGSPSSINSSLSQDGFGLGSEAREAALRKPSAQARRRTVRLFDGAGPAPPGMERRPSKGTLGLIRAPSGDLGLGPSSSPIVSSQSFANIQLPQATPIPMMEEEQQALQKEEKQAAGEESSQENSDEESSEESSDGEFEDCNPEFIDPLTPDIMAHLLSKDVSYQGEEDYDEELTEEESSDPESEEDFQDIEDLFPVMVQKQEEMINTLAAENERLQELLEAEIISHHKAVDLNKESFQTLEEKARELEERAQIAEARARQAESERNKLKTILEERDKSMTLLSRMANQREADLYTANIRIIQLIERLQKLESQLKSPSVSMDNIRKDSLETPTETPTDTPYSTPAQTPSELTTPTSAPSPIFEPPEPKIEEKEKMEASEHPMEKKDALRFVVTKKMAKRRSAIISPVEYLRAMEEHGPKISHSSIKPIIQIEETEHHYRMWKQHPEVAPILSKFSENEISRQEILYEFIGTETSYNRDLDLILRRFVHPMKDLIGTPKFTKVDFANIFQNLEEIVKVNHAFLLDLQERNKTQWPAINNIADIFLKHAPFFDIYAEYCGDQQRSVKEMKRAESDSVYVKAHLESALLEKECRKLDIYAFLLLPMQRITKYPLLLKSLLKKTPEDHPDYEFIKASLTEIDRTIKTINDYTRRRDEIDRILTIDKQLDCSLIKTPINLSNSEEKGRHILREGLLTRLRLKSKRLAAEKSQGRKLEKLFLFFFSDMLIITKQFRSTPESPARYIVQVKPLRYSEIAVRNVPDASNGIGAKNIFLVSSQATGTMVLQAATAEEKALWINDFRKEDLIVKSLLKLEAVDTDHDKMVLDNSGPLTAPPITAPPPFEIPSPDELLNRAKSTSSFPPKVRTLPEDEEPEAVAVPLEKKTTWLLGVKKPETFLDITASELSQPEFDGWLKVLTKGAFQRGIWKWRYCILKDFSLYFFQTEDHDARATSLLLLPGYSIVAQKAPNKKNVFEVQHPNISTNTVLLSADTPEYMNIWIEALTHATLSRIAPRNFWL